MRYVDSARGWILLWGWLGDGVSEQPKSRREKGIKKPTKNGKDQSLREIDECAKNRKKKKQ